MHKFVRIIIPTLLVLVLLGGIGFFAMPDHVFAQVQGEKEVTQGIAPPAGGGDDPISCGITNFLSRDCMLYGFAVIVNEVLKVVAATVWLSGLLLNEAVVSTVLKMGTLVKEMGAIETGWTIFRDLGNIALIFLMIAIAISTILRLESYGVRKLLARLIIVALLLNFSLFFTRLIIDGSNLLALQFWNQIAIDKTEGDAGLSDAFMQPLQLTSLYDTSGTPFTGSGENRVSGFDQALKDKAITFGKVFMIGILGSILLLVTAFVFFAAAILLVTRFVILILLMMLAPLAFVAMIAPLTAGYASKWWGALLNQSFFAPAYFALTWAALGILNSPAFRTALVSESSASTGAFGGLLLGNKDLVVILLQFTIVIILMIATLVIAKQMGAYGASTVIGWGQSWRKSAQSVIGRNTVGRAANWANKKYTGLEARMEKTATGRAARSALSIATLGALSDASVRGTLKSGAETKFGGSKSFLDQDKATKARKKELSQTRSDIEDKEAAERLAAGTGTAEDISRMNKMTKRQVEELGYKQLSKEGVAQHLSTEALEAVKKSDEFSEEQAEAIVEAHFGKMKRGLALGPRAKGTKEYDDARTALRNLSDKELEMFGENRLQDPDIINELKQSQRDALKKSNKISAATKTKIKEVRDAFFDELLQKGPAAAAAELGKMSPADLGKLDDKFFTDQKYSDTLLPHVSPAVMQEMIKDNKSEAVKRAVRDHVMTVGKYPNASDAEKRAYEQLNSPTTVLSGMF